MVREAVRNSTLAVVTFARPLSNGEFEKLAGRGVELVTFEAIGELPEGHTYTISGETQFLDLVAEDFAEVGAEERGIVAGTVRLGSAGAYKTLVTNRDVLLVDLSAEWITRELAARPSTLEGLPRSVDVQVNDVYWQYAGLDR